MCCFEQILEKAPPKQQLYGHIPFILQTIQVKRARHAGHCWWSNKEHLSYVPIWTATHGHNVLDLYGHLLPITKTIQVRRTRHAGHCWRSRDELICDLLLWTPTYSRAKAVRSVRTYIQQLWKDMWCSTEELPESMNDRGSGISVLAARHDDDDDIHQLWVDRRRPVVRAGWMI